MEDRCEIKDGPARDSPGHRKRMPLINRVMIEVSVPEHGNVGYAGGIGTTGK